MEKKEEESGSRWYQFAGWKVIAEIAFSVREGAARLQPHSKYNERRE